MPESVVDVGKPVEVHHDQGQRLVGALGSQDSLVEAIPEQRAVREACEGIVVALVGQFILGGLSADDLRYVTLGNSCRRTCSRARLSGLVT